MNHFFLTVVANEYIIKKNSKPKTDSINKEGEKINPLYWFKSC